MLKQPEDDVPVGAVEALEALLAVFAGVEEAARDAGEFRRGCGPVTLILDEATVEAALEVRSTLEAARLAEQEGCLEEWIAGGSGR